jgi:formylglycine-generating enzyme required for sulfatase activity
MKKTLLIFAITLLSSAVLVAQAKPTMIAIEGGTFTMGSSEEKPTHTVTVSSFSMGKYEITVAEYKAFCTAVGRSMPYAPSWGWNDKHPMVRVNFNDANAYCSWLSETTGQNYRLPTEAEWEYAARGGQKNKGYTYSGGNDIEEAGWCSDNAGGQTQAVGRKQSNELGLYDMSGNVWEWCSDWYGSYTSEAQTNPRGASKGTNRVLRGGSWYFVAACCRVDFRRGSDPEDLDGGNGFRVVLAQ